MILRRVAKKDKLGINTSIDIKKLYSKTWVALHRLKDYSGEG